MNPRDGKVARSIDAAELLAEIARAAWASGDPGVIFLDAVEPRESDAGARRCSRRPIPAASCRCSRTRAATSARCASPPSCSDGAIEWERLDAAVDLGVRFLDDVIEVSRHPFPEIAAATRGNRKIGLGVMGFADLLVDLGVAYDEPEAVRSRRAG